MMFRKTKNKQFNNAGFTLIEVALALMVLGIGMLSLIAVFPAGLNAGRNSANDMAAIEFAEAVFNDYEWHMADPNGKLALTGYTVSDDLVDSGGAHYKASGTLGVNSWLTIDQDTPAGSFPAFQVKLTVDSIAGGGDLRRVSLYFVKPGISNPGNGDAYQVFSRYFTFF